VALVFFLLHRSLWLTALALVVNVAPIGPTAAAMALAGVRLDVATIMVASIALGIVVDDTIHMLHAWRRGLELTRDADAALAYALGVAGRPTILTAVILVTGFGALALSDFQPTAHFGALVAFTVAVSLAVELVVMPPALRWLAPRFLPAPRANPEPRSDLRTRARARRPQRPRRVWHAPCSLGAQGDPGPRCSSLRPSSS
jgi:predicted RND superfamily exporter protein